MEVIRKRHQFRCSESSRCKILTRKFQISPQKYNVRRSSTKFIGGYLSLSLSNDTTQRKKKKEGRREDVLIKGLQALNKRLRPSAKRTSNTAHEKEQRSKKESKQTNDGKGSLRKQTCNDTIPLRDLFEPSHLS